MDEALSRMPCLDSPVKATMGFEPMHRGFADPCLTTWLRRHAAISLAQEARSGKIENSGITHISRVHRVISTVAAAVVVAWLFDPDHHS
jgi:hypothetical protein